MAVDGLVVGHEHGMFVGSGRTAGEGYFPPEAAFLDETARERNIRCLPIDWRMDAAKQSEAEAAEPASEKEKSKAHADKLGGQIKSFSGVSLYDFLHSPDCLSAIDLLYEQIKGEGTVSDIAAGSWHERNRRRAAEPDGRAA